MEEVCRVGAGIVTFQAEALSCPIGATPKRINWRYAFAVGSYHLIALLAFYPWFFSRTGVALAVAGVYVFGAAGINLCYHRLLSHRSFSCPLWLEHTFAIIAVCCLEDTPARWVATHRLHHHRADDRADPHSPLVNLFWSYIGWLFVENTDLCRGVAYDRYARDIIRDRFYRWIERNVVWITLAQSVVYFAAGFLIERSLGGTMHAALQFGASVWLWGVIIRTVLVWHVTWCGNSFPHMFGYRNYETNDNSRNNALVAIITSGEGWHNNHHAEPGSASNQRHWWEIDLTYLLLQVLVQFGLAWDVQLPKRALSPGI
ncbi:acyl-CoA desaturase [Bradyrhizobium canariense]|uniref:Delta-9 acyl-phospholipid desaturase n=1 Tax=Bradyrhizobium canariense TaxID=255045 RepID=A0A1H1MDB2_9BRAD|nr:fatty acid desaturase [Bradyrhizobium canariense]SDR84706.1 Delta-9 acyl-phospholipid desaturase [Bradyrhizobium canariense]